MMEATPEQQDPKPLWIIRGKAYDLTEFVERHPGGSALLLSVQGTDCTAQFERVHDDMRKPLAILSKMTPVDLPAEVLASFTAKEAEEEAAVAPSPWPSQAPAKEKDAVVVITLDDEAAGGSSAEVYEDVDPDLLWYIHGKAYDLSDLVGQHPGGREALESTQGRDCTALFESYHAFVDRPHAMLAALKEVRLQPAVLSSRVADVSKRGWFRLPDGTTDPFWATLKERCRKKLEELGETPRTMPWTEFLCCMGLLAAMAALYTFGYLSWDWGVSVASAAVLGVLAWLLARLGHDGSHFAVSRHPWVNRVSTVLGTMCVTNPFYWVLLHSVAHHSVTNQPEDPDMFHFDIMLRMTPEYPFTKWHKLQRHRWWVYGWWALTVYGLTTEEPIRMLMEGTGTAPNPGIRLTKNRPVFWVCLVAHLLGFWFFALFLPFYVKWHSPSLLPVWGTFLAQLGVMLLYWVVAGSFFGLFTQVNHCTEGSVDASFKRTSWAQQQVETACDFAPQSLLWDILSSGVHIQIEHHLFPSLSARRLKAIVPVVQEVCREFGVEHQTFDTFGACLASVHRHLGAMAAEGCKLPALEAELEHGPRPFFPTRSALVPPPADAPAS